jgi:hypothetical protein
MSEREDEDQIVLKTKEEDGQKTAAAGIVLFDKTSYKDEKIKDPLVVAPEKHGE